MRHRVAEVSLALAGEYDQVTEVSLRRDRAAAAALGKARLGLERRGRGQERSHGAGGGTCIGDVYLSI